MPGFVKTKADEERWSKAKEAAAKETAPESTGYWKLSNYIFHKMGKSGYDVLMCDLYKSELIKAGLGGLTAMPKPTVGAGSLLKPPSLTGGAKNPAQTGSQQTSVKMPKAKKMPDPFGKPSLFNKSENIKHPNLLKLQDFINRKR